MLSPDHVKKQIDAITGDLIEVGLCSRQNFAIRRDHSGGITEITTEKYDDMTIFLKDIEYGDMYIEVLSKEIYNLLLIDGAIVQMQYYYRDGEIDKHRLAFFPSPNLEEYQNNPEVYETDELYADILVKSIYPAPMRFDFDRRSAVELDHPMSHLTIGQYKNCRIPVSAPTSPSVFMDFILRSFYNTGYRKCYDKLTVFTERYSATITPVEAKSIYLSLPATSY
ncbi:MAG: DUF2290 domain-containing protein [Mesorhizobium sp.]|uniref:DUF2290 domain-containing protein n=1 Tax=Mesorhizobium sp. TaxID=1871066 RepID=UPI000FE8716D|nr:DUF2290 domain-containing protein [Mesorhizobium sp.]RWP14867.1 MAG: DUF2290 domain-containing protein [Mesorhizobium sp.]